MLPWAHTSPTPNGIPIGSAALHSSWQKVPILYNGPPLSPSKLSFRTVGIWTPFNTRFLGPTRVHIPNDISIGLAVFAGLTTVTDRTSSLFSVQPPRSTRSSSLVTLARSPTSSSLRITDRSFRYASPCLWDQLPIFSVNLIPVPLSLTCLFMLLPHLLTLSTYHSHHP